MKPFTVPEMSFKVHSSCRPTLDRLDFLSETGKVGFFIVIFTENR